MKRIAAYILIALAVICLLFYRNYNGTMIAYPSIFLFLGISLGLFGFFILKNALKTEINQAQKIVLFQIDNLKKNGEMLLVNLDDCEIKENKYTEEIPVGSNDSQALNVLSGNAMKNVSQLNVSQCVLVYNCLNKETGVQEKFVSPIINMDKQNLMFYLVQQKSTQIFVDRNDRSFYYFDVEFIR